ncbi:hypothetical protein [Robertmurraya andreesenii]|uniref:Uncharacterized protein n=1 Tax=Anoxybacillus andreesenii TaxID=1325932 RepID=A0ABT9V1X0_9BACL|nr:hypothetical protein [Robertmurraya andreesenii]MDQ0154938.1 hypothetical protein [Robertmurraya andreesenii]
MPFEPLSVASRGDNAVTIDKYRRLRLSSAAIKTLAVTQFTPVVVSVDVENKRIGIVKQELAKVPNASTVRPDKRGYLGTAIGKKVCDKLALTDADLPVKFVYVGKVDDGPTFWHTFELA